MYKGYGNITCDYCEVNVTNIDFTIVKDKNGVTHFCDDECLKKYLETKTEEPKDGI